jgi:hypothetical protein
MSRRQFLNRSVAAGVAVGSLAGAAADDSSSTDAVSNPTKVYAAADGDANTRPPMQAVRQGEMPSGKIGPLKISRLISGGNIISGWCHARDLQFVRNLAEAYLTPRKQFDTLQFLEEQGVNTIVLDQMQMGILQQYRRERGGHMQTLVATRQDWGDWGKPGWDSLKRQIQQAIEDGPNALFIHGGYADQLVQSGKPERVELIGRALEFIRAQGFPAGLGAHALEVPMACDRQGVTPDFYFKTFHHDQYWSATPRERRRRFCVDGPRHLDHNEFHDNIFCIDPEATIEFMRNKTQPWVAFKVLAGGAIPPKSGFEYAFNGGADFLAVGMFDFEVAHDVKIVRELLKDLRRDRPWRG